MTLSINSVVLPKATFTINSNRAMRVGRLWPWVLLKDGGWVGGCHWSVLFWTSLKLYMEQIFDRLAVVFSLIHFWMMWIFSLESTSLLLTAIKIWRLFNPEALRTWVYSAFMTTSWQFTAGRRVLVVDWVLSRKKSKGMVVSLDHWLCLDLIIFFSCVGAESKNTEHHFQNHFIFLLVYLIGKGSAYKG